MPLPQNLREYTVHITRVDTFSDGDITWHGAFSQGENHYDVAFTQSHGVTAGSISTENGHYTLRAHGNEGWVNSMNSFLSQRQVNFRIRFLSAQQYRGPLFSGDALGFLRSVEQTNRNLRQQKGADYIQFISGQQAQLARACSGFAQIQGSTSVVSPRCGARVALHEIGHNRGLRHSERQDGPHARQQAGPGRYMQMITRDAFGYGEDGRFVTIKAYPSAFGIRENSVDALNTFSNPNVSHRGRRTGRSNLENSARALNQYASRYINQMPSRQSNTGTNGDTDGTTGTNNTTPSRDKHPACGTWAQEGYCTGSIYQTYMQQNCATSCSNTNTNTNNRLIDKHRYCPRWAASGYCRAPAYRQYMLNNCQKSCASAR